MSKKIIPVVIFVLLLFTGIIAVTQEGEFFFAGRESESAPVEDEEVIISDEVNSVIDDIFSDYVFPAEKPNWVNPLRWFRSNKGGMALEEVSSQLIAMRGEYALAVGFANKKKLPENILPYYDDRYFIEVHVLHDNGKPVRTQWIFRDISGTVRLNAVFLGASELEEKKREDSDKRQKSGFIEIFDDSSFLISEYDFFDDGGRNRTDYNYKDGFLTSIAVFSWEDDPEGGAYREDYADFLRYNRSLYLRSVERVFYKGRQISLANEPLIVSLPRYLSEVTLIKDQVGEKINVYPEFFGDVILGRDNKIVYTTDTRSRIVSQTLYDDEGNIVWVIRNTWSNDRIASTVKTENGTEFAAEFEYNSSGDRILERNYKNGILERLVRTEGKTETEELYINNVVVLRAVWENGRKISETRTGSR